MVLYAQPINREELRLTDYVYRFEEMAVGRVSDKQPYRDLIRQILELTVARPNWAEPYEQAANIGSFIGDNYGAIQHAQRALELDQRSWAAYRTLVVAFAELGQFNKGAPLVLKAVELNSRLMSDTEFMYAASLTAANVGDVKRAEGILTRLTELRPEVASDPKYKKLLTQIQQSKMR